METRRAYVTLSILWITWFWQITCGQMVTALMPAIQKSLLLSTGATGLLFGLFNLGSTAGWLLSGFLCAKLGRVKVIVLSVIVSSLCMLSVSLVTNYLSLSILECLLGFGYSAYLPAGMALLVDLFSSRQRGRFIGVHEMAPPAAMTLGPIFASLMLNLGFGWVRCLQVWVVPATIIIAIQLLFMRGQDKRPSLEDGQSAQVTLKSGSWPLICLLLLVAAQFLRNTSNSEISLLPVYWVSDLNVAVGTSAFIYGITRVFAVFAQVGAGYLSDIFGRLRVLLAMQIAGSVLLIPTSYLGFGPLMFTSFAGLSITTTCYMPVLFALISDSTQHIERPKIIGIVLGVGGVSSIISPTILGLLAENFSFRTAWIYPIVTSFMSIPLLALLRSRLKVRVS